MVLGDGERHQPDKGSNWVVLGWKHAVVSIWHRFVCGWVSYDQRALFRLVLHRLRIKSIGMGFLPVLVGFRPLVQLAWILSILSFAPGLGRAFQALHAVWVCVPIGSPLVVFLLPSLVAT